MAFYVLIGFNTTQEQDHYRVTKLRDLGCDPYAMPFDKLDPFQRDFSGSVTSCSGRNSCRRPSPLQSRHIPSGLLKLNNCGVGGS